MLAKNCGKNFLFNIKKEQLKYKPKPIKKIKPQ